MAITDEQWGHAQAMVHSSSICARHGLIQCKILHRVHYTNAKLSKIYPNVKDACNRCNQSPANHTYMFWSCPKLTTFWMNFFDTLSRAYEHTISPNPLSAIFGISPDADLPVVLERALAFTSLLARRLILLNWKLPRPPTHDRWIKEVLDNLRLEKLRSSLKGTTSKSLGSWNPFLGLVDSLNLSPDLEV